MEEWCRVYSKLEELTQLATSLSDLHRPKVHSRFIALDKLSHQILELILRFYLAVDAEKDVSKSVSILNRFFELEQKTLGENKLDPKSDLDIIIEHVANKYEVFLFSQSLKIMKERLDAYLHLELLADALAARRI